MTDEQISTAASQWAQGAQIIEIGHYLGISRWQAMRVMELYRHMFPKRYVRNSKYGPKADRTRDRSRAVDETPKQKQIGPGEMAWVTESGAAVTLPRVSFISCPRSE